MNRNFAFLSNTVIVKTLVNIIFSIVLPWCFERISHQGITFIPGILYAIRQRLLLRLYKTINTDQLFQAIFYNIPVETKEMRNASQKKL